MASLSNNITPKDGITMSAWVYPSCDASTMAGPSTPSVSPPTPAGLRIRFSGAEKGRRDVQSIAFSSWHSDIDFVGEPTVDGVGACGPLTLSGM